MLSASRQTDRADFVRGARVLFKHGTDTDDEPAFVVENDNYLSARWPGDAYQFAKAIRRPTRKLTLRGRCEVMRV
jgi:hypothetical protein